MKFEKHSFLLLAATMLLATLCTTLSRGEQPAAPPANGAAASPATPPPAAPVPVAAPGKAQPSKTPPITEDSLRARYVGKMVFLRGFYSADNLDFDMDGKVNGNPATTSFTLSALEVRKVHLSKRKLEMEADRYALHFFGALPYESDAKAYDKVRISKKPVHISIERQLVVIPKVKKEKKKKEAAKAAPGSLPTPAVVAPAIPKPAVEAADSKTTISPEHSAMLLNTALDNIFASDIDQRMLARLPGYWQAYFTSKREHREFTPEDPNVKTVGGNVTAPKVLNSIDPSSNEYAQKYGIAGLTLFRTVVDASGKPEEIAIARPIGFGLDEKAVQAIQASHFIPATENGHPVPVVIDVVVTFRIYSNRTKPGSVPRGAKSAMVAAAAWDQDASKPSGRH